MSSLWEYFDLQGPWQKVLTELKKSLYTLQADPEKSRDFIIKNPGILINWKSRDPGIPGIPLGPGHQMVDGEHKVKDEITRELTKEVKDMVGE